MRQETYPEFDVVIGWLDEMRQVLSNEVKTIVFVGPDHRRQPAERAMEYSPGRQPWVTGPPLAEPRRGDGKCFRAKSFRRPRWGLASPRGLAQGSLRFALGFIPPPLRGWNLASQITLRGSARAMASRPP